MIVVTIIIILGIILSACARSLKIARKEKEAIEELNAIYAKREAEEARRMQLIAEKPENVVFLSKLNTSKIIFRYIGKFDSLDAVAPEEYDIASYEGREFLYMNNKWYEIVDDLPRLKRNK